MNLFITRWVFAKNILTYTRYVSISAQLHSLYVGTKIKIRPVEKVNSGSYWVRTQHTWKFSFHILYIYIYILYMVAL